ncbi:hypothetical protein [Mangrovibacterium sp.]|uniref:hypothetical protein n=1 Tax=Mangrovibacterium sp. TaxID=1961364 RepID=UPI0035687EB7
MKTKHPLLFVIILVALIVQSCSSPKNIVKLLPKEETSKWLYGQPILTDSIYGVAYEIGFDRLQDDQYWFDFHITNRSNMPLLVDPAQFSYQAFDPLMNPKSQQPITAIDPEIKIQQFDKDIARNQAVSKNRVGLVIMGIGASVVANAIIGTENPRNNNLRHAVTDGIMEASFAAGHEARFEVQNLNELKDAWENGTIRKTTLDTNFSMHGKVFFPATPDASYLRIFIPIDDHTLEFDFKQVQFPAN